MLKKNSTAKRHSDKLVMPDGAFTAVKGTPVGVMYSSCLSVTHQSLRFTEWCYTTVCLLVCAMAKTQHY